MNKNGYYSYSDYLRVVQELQDKFPMAVASAGKIGESFLKNDIMRIDIALPGNKKPNT